MKKLLLFLCMSAIAFALQAQDEKLRVAVFDPTSSGISIDVGTREAVRELISSTFVNTGKYTMVERSMLQQIMKEQKMSNTDSFDDSQATELGKLAGAHKVVLSVVSLVGGRNVLSVKLIDVKTATVDQQKTKIVQSNDLLDAVEPLVLELMGNQVTYKQVANNNTAPQKSSNVDYSNKSTGSISDCSQIELEGFDRKIGIWTANGSSCCPKDWELPTPEEAECLCKNKKQFKKAGTPIKEDWYWTNAELDAEKAYAIRMDDCKVFVKKKKDAGIVVRCIRKK